MTLEGVIHENVGIEHSDRRRMIKVLFNGNFTAKQGKLISTYDSCRMGDHYHGHDELYFVLEGEITFTLEDPVSKERGTYELGRHDFLYIPKGIAHRTDSEDMVTFMGFTSEPYESAEKSTTKYPIEI